MTSATGGTTLLSQLLDLLEYRVVLGAVATTLDGLVVAQAGLPDDDAELLAAAAASAGPDARQLPAAGGAIQVRHGSEMRLIVLTEPNVPLAEVERVMQAQLAALEDAIAA
jgi:hypothetical protein